MQTAVIPKKKYQVDHKFKAEDVEAIRKLYSEGKSRDEVAKLYGVCGDTILKRMKKTGLANLPKPIRHKQYIPDSEADKVKELAQVQGMMQAEIGEIYKVTQPTVSKFMIHHNILPSNGRGRKYTA